MGYTTSFNGFFYFDRELDDNTFNLIRGLNDTRRMKRTGADPEFGVDGEFYYGEGNGGTVVDQNRPPSTQPGLWMQWTPTDDKQGLEWDGGEKFYNYTEWLHYLNDKIFLPRGYTLNGSVTWSGEENGDAGTITAEANVITSLSYDQMIQLKEEALVEVVKLALSSGLGPTLLTSPNSLIRKVAKDNYEFLLPSKTD